MEIIVPAVVILLGVPFYLYVLEGKNLDGTRRSPWKFFIVVLCIFAIGLLYEIIRCKFGWLPNISRYEWADLCPKS